MIKQLTVVLFCHQNQWFAFEASWVKGQGSCSFYDPKALLLPFNQFLNQSTAKDKAQQTTHWLRLAAQSTDAKPWLLGIASEAELIELPAEQIHALPPHLLARRTFPALQAVAWYQQRLVSIIDARVLQGLAHPWLASVTPDVSQAE